MKNEITRVKAAYSSERLNELLETRNDSFIEWIAYKKIVIVIVLNCLIVTGTLIKKELLDIFDQFINQLQEHVYESVSEKVLDTSTSIGSDFISKS